MRNFKLFILALVSLFTLGACSDSGSDVPDVDYTQEIIGVWSYYDEVSDFSDKFEFKTDGTFWNYGNEGDEIWDYEGQWKLNANELVLTTAEGELLRAIVDVFDDDVIVMNNLTTGTKRVYHYLTYDDYAFPSNLVGTWTCLEEGYAEALTITEEGITYSTGVANGTYWEDRVGVMLFVVDGNYMGINEETEEFYGGRYEIVSGKLLAITNLDTGVCHTYQFCEQDLSEEIVGMWVCNETPSAEENDMLIMTYNEDGSTSFSGYFYEADGFGANMEASYKVIGDLLIHKQPDIALEYGLVQYTGMRLIYSPNGTSLGDVMSLKAYASVGDKFVETTTSWLRIKQNLHLANRSYDYSATYITNAKGEDKDITFLNNTFNFAKMDGSIIDKFLKSVLFSVNFPDADTIEYCCLLEGQKVALKLPIVVDGNKMTIKMSERDAMYRDVDLYTFQDVDGCQMHMYMHTYAFENFFSNMAIAIMTASGQLDKNDKAAVEGVYKSVTDAIESINVSLVYKASK